MSYLRKSQSGHLRPGESVIDDTTHEPLAQVQVVAGFQVQLEQLQILKVSVTQRTPQLAGRQLAETTSLTYNSYPLSSFYNSFKLYN